MKTKERIRDACGMLCRKYAEQYPVLHGNLSRFTGLLIMLNVTLFFVGGAVIHEGFGHPLPIRWGEGQGEGQFGL